MSKDKKKISIWEHYLTKEIGIEFKACLYFFCILFFYSLYKLIHGIYEANIIHMAEMIGSTYIIGYIQVYFLSDFDEAEHLKLKEIFYMFFCTFIYTGISFLCKWFDRKLIVSIYFFLYVIIIYLCTFLVYKSKRKLEEKLLNSDLKDFQKRREYEKCNRN